jgi:hypothetical protein
MFADIYEIFLKLMNMNPTVKILLAAMLLLPGAISAQVAGNGRYGITSPEMNIKTNLLWDVTTTANLGVEFRIGDKTSLDLPVNYNAWVYANNRKWKHILVQPEFRWWPKETFNGHFWGFHAHYAFYNVGNLPKPPFSAYMQNNRFEGWLAGTGISYGYRMNFNLNWAMEATVGAGYAYLSYNRFDCRDCGQKNADKTTNWFGPTRAGISLIYDISGKSKQ